jgi:DNA-binding PadR family transcriptional regulator
LGIVALTASANGAAQLSRSWAQPGGLSGRWIDPFVLLLVAESPSPGYALIGRLNEPEVTSKGVDVGMVYRTLRQFDTEGLMETAGDLETGPPRRGYRLTAKGHQRLDEWVGVMAERKRLTKAFLERSHRLGPPEGR